MKKLLLLFFTLFSVFGNAQFYENNFIYTSFGGSMFGEFTGPEVSLEYVNSKNYSFELGYMDISHESPSRPSDYHTTSLIGFELGARDHLQSFKVLAGRTITTRKKWARFNLKGGLMYSRVTQATNWQKVTRSFLFSSYNDYEFDTEEFFRLGFMIQPSFELHFSRWLGVSISPFLQLNNKITTRGCSMKLVMGLLRA